MNSHNFLLNSQAKLTLNIMNKIWELNVQKFNIPSINLSPIEMNHQGVTGSISNGELEYGDLSVEILLDEKMIVYNNIFEYILSIRDYDGTFENESLNGNLTVTNASDKPVFALELRECHLKSIGEVDLDVSSDNSEPATLSLEFAIKDFLVVKKFEEE